MIKYIKKVLHFNNLNCNCRYSCGGGKLSKISPSIICFDYTNLQRQLDFLKKNDIKMLHIDVMDGMFVEQITIGGNFVKQIKNSNPYFIADIHLMVINPLDKIETFARSGADEISFHYEATGEYDDNGDIDECIKILNKIHSYNKNIKAGIAINPDTSIDVLRPILEIESKKNKKKHGECSRATLVDKILIMSVNPGLSGQTFIQKSIKKIDELNQLLHEFDLNNVISIQIDGGINEYILSKLLNKNIDSFVIGSALHKDESGCVCFGDKHMEILKKNLLKFNKIFNS